MKKKYFCPNCNEEINPGAILASGTTDAKTAACRENAKRPRPGARGKRKTRKEKADDPKM